METKSLTPAEVGSAWVESGVKKAGMPAGKMFLLAMFAGAFIGFGGYAYLVAVGNLTDTAVPAQIAKLIGAGLFPVGLMLVVFCGAELFTGNSLLVISLLDKKISFSAMLRNWGIVYLGNLAGSYLMALVIYWSGLVPAGSAVAATAASVAATKSSLPFMQALLRGVLCNMLVVLAVWIQTASKDLIGKIMGIWFPITLFVFSGFEHSIANFFFIPLGQLLGSAATFSGMYLNNILPVTLGNIIGGGVIIAAPFWYAHARRTEPAPYDPLNPPLKKKRAAK